MKKLAILALLSVGTFTSMGICYIAGLNCLCLTAGACYGNQTPTGCSTPTCLIADSNGYGPNICAGSGPYTSRSPAPAPNDKITCVVAACRIWNNCTQRYEQPPLGCNFKVTNYQGNGSNCI